MIDRSKYRRVSATLEERTAYNASKGRASHRTPPVYRYECVDCGKRLWGSGLGLGSHNRACVR